MRIYFVGESIHTDPIVTRLWACDVTETPAILKFDNHTKESRQLRIACGLSVNQVQKSKMEAFGIAATPEEALRLCLGTWKHKLRCAEVRAEEARKVIAAATSMSLNEEV